MEQSSPPVEGLAVERLDEGRDEFPPQPVLISSELSIDGENLVLSLQNSTGASATVSLSALIHNPEALFFTESAGRASLAPNEFIEIVLSPGKIQGLNLTDDEWTDATVNVEYELGDGRQGGDPVSIFAEYGQVAPPRPVTSSGESHAMPGAPVPAEEVEKQAATFRLCFQNVVTFSGSTQNDLDAFPSPTIQFAAAGVQLRNVRHVPTNVTHAARFLDTSGCTTLPRIAGTWSFSAGLSGLGFPRANNSLIAFKANGLIPEVTVLKAIGDDFNPTVTPITMTAGEDRELQAAYTAASMTMSRVAAVSANLVPATRLLIQMNASKTDYSHDLKMIRVTPTSARSRLSVSHETGHWLHFMNALPSCTAANGLNHPNCHMAQDYNYCKAGDADCTPPAADDCTRTTDSTHNFSTVEWNSSAHVEGMANLFTALTFNNAVLNGDCRLVDTAAPNRDCEAEGKTLERGLTGNGPCFEWLDAQFFNTGAELDYTKMYWDFIADERQSLLTYLTSEVGRTWTRRNHGAKIFEGLTTTMNSALRRSAVGNIQEGPAH